MRVLAVAERDLRRLQRNPLTIVSVIVLPLAYLLILGNSLLGPIKGLRLGVVAEDAGPETRDLLGALHAVQNGPKTVRLVTVRDAQDGMRLLRDGELSGLLVIPEGFSRDVERGVAASAGLWVDNADGVAANAVIAAVQSAFPSMSQPLARFELHLGPPELRPQEVYPRVDYDASLIPGVVVMAIFMASMISAGFNLVLDRFMGVHESYLSTPLTRLDLALGVLISGVLVALVSSGVVFTIGVLITRTHIHGGVVGIVGVFAVQLLASLGLLAMMMALLGRANHPRVVGVIGGFLNVILFFPSGALYPVQGFPRWLRAFAQVNPETHAILALKGILFRAASLATVFSHVLFLAVFAAIMVAIATTTLKRTL